MFVAAPDREAGRGSGAARAISRYVRAGRVLYEDPSRYFPGSLSNLSLHAFEQKL